ncbi:hypothetical protein C5167_016388 [Papaver somniferum]|nr:hypothetical protein C5167_016388 [Papaver somniferum]
MVGMPWRGDVAGMVFHWHDDAADMVFHWHGDAAGMVGMPWCGDVAVMVSHWHGGATGMVGMPWRGDVADMVFHWHGGAAGMVGMPWRGDVDGMVFHWHGGLKPVRDSATRLYTRAGEIIRIHVPINFTDWRLVPDNFKDDVWEALLVLAADINIGYEGIVHIQVRT